MTGEEPDTNRPEPSAEIERLRGELRQYRDELKRLAAELEAYREVDAVRSEAVAGAVREAEAARDRFIELYERAPVAYVMLNASGLIRQMNQAAAMMLGVDQKRDSRIPLMGFVVNRDRRKLLDHLWKCRNTTEEVVTEQVMVSAAGRMFVAQLVSRSPSERENSGRTDTLVPTAIIDLTEHQVADDARHKLAAVVEASDDAIIALSVEGKVESWNRGAQRLTGYKAAAMLGQSLDRLIPVDRAQTWAQLLERLRLGLGAEHVHVVWERSDGSRAEVSLTLSPIHDPHGKVIGGSVVGRDLTERRRSEARQRELNERLARRAQQLRELAGELTQVERRERRRLAHILHDDLQQILVAAKLRIGMARNHSDDPGLRGSLEKVDQMLDDSVRISRSLTSELAPPLLHERGLLAGLRWFAERMKQTHHLRVDLNGEEEACPANPLIRDLLFETIREMLFNVVKHADTNVATVTIQTLENDEIRAVVEDRGAGFDPSAVQRGSRPTGFGLFSAAERLQLVGGHLDIDSRPGAGTRMTITVPADHAPHGDGNGGDDL